MAKVVAVAKNVKGSVQKIKIPVDIVRGMKVDYALSILEFMPKRAAKEVWKVVKSARANATHNQDLNSENLFIQEIRVDKGNNFKRFKAGSRGNANPIIRYYSNISVVLSDEVISSEESAK